jgi:alkylhydroperoxidase family enzyme
VYWHHQKVLTDLAGVGAKIKKWDACDEQLKSFAHMAVASQVGCTWCLDFNYFEAHNRDLDMVKAREVPRWRESDAFSPLEREVLGYAEAMTETEPTVTDEMVASLRGHLGDAAFSELVRAYVATFRDRVATPRAFFDLAQSASRADLNPLFARYFGYAAYQYPASQSWTLEAPAIPWRGSAALFVGADFPVTRVEFWLDGRPLARGPENAVTVDLTGVAPGEYVLLARVWNHDGTIFERARRVEVGA